MCVCMCLCRMRPTLTKNENSYLTFWLMANEHRDEMKIPLVVFVCVLTHALNFQHTTIGLVEKYHSSCIVFIRSRPFLVGQSSWFSIRRWQPAKQYNQESEWLLIMDISCLQTWEKKGNKHGIVFEEPSVSVHIFDRMTLANKVKCRTCATTLQAKASKNGLVCTRLVRLFVVVRDAFYSIDERVMCLFVRVSVE